MRGVTTLSTAVCIQSFLEPLCDAVEFARPADGTAVRARDMRAVVGKLLVRLVGMAVDVGYGRRGLSFGALSERRESRERTDVGLYLRVVTLSSHKCPIKSQKITRDRAKIALRSH